MFFAITDLKQKVTIWKYLTDWEEFANLFQSLHTGTLKKNSFFSYKWNRLKVTKITILIHLLI